MRLSQFDKQAHAKVNIFFIIVVTSTYEEEAFFLLYMTDLQHDNTNTLIKFSIYI